MNRVLVTAGTAFLIGFLSGCGSSGSTASPGPVTTPGAKISPSPVLLARGTFTLYGAEVQLNATGGGDSVTGTMTMSHESGDFSVDLKCSRTTEDGVILIAGDITDSTSPFARKGAREVIVLKRGSPVYASFDSEGRPGGDVRPAASCPALLEQVMGTGTQTVIGEGGLEPIEGIVEFGT